jgi:hypothetical protein
MAAHLWSLGGGDALHPPLLLGTIERVNAIDGLYSMSDFAQMVGDCRLRQRAYESVRSFSQRRVWGHDLTPGKIVGTRSRNERHPPRC